MNEKFASLEQPQRIWVVGNAQGNAWALQTLHDCLADVVSPGDRLVYLGGYAALDVSFDAIDELLTFRRCLLSKPGMFAHDIVYLRGPAEEAWVRLFRLSFSAAPDRDLKKIMDAGGRDYLYAYGWSEGDAHKMARGGISVIARWLNDLRNHVRSYPGHDALWNTMRRAAYTDVSGGGVLCVPAGFNPHATLADQNEAIWIARSGFDTITGPCQGFNRIVRGYSHDNFGLDVGPATLSLDPAAGEGPLLAACLRANGHIEQIVSVQNGEVRSESTEVGQKSAANVHQPDLRQTA